MNQDRAWSPGHYATPRLAKIQGLQADAAQWHHMMDAMDFPLTDLNSARAMFEALQARAASQGTSLRPPPPEPTSCCGRGCNGCVWEGYYAAALYWRDEALLILSD